MTSSLLFNRGPTSLVWLKKTWVVTATISDVKAVLHDSVITPNIDSQSPALHFGNIH